MQTSSKKNFRNQRLYIVFSLLIAAALVLSACGGGEAPTATSAPPTEAPAMPTEAPAVPTEAAAPPPGPTPNPTVPVALLPTAAAGQAVATAQFNTYIYSGPGTNYVVYGLLAGGRTATAVGRSEDGLWWAISIPVAPESVGWGPTNLITVSGGESLPVLPTPPVPPSVAFTPPGPDDPQVITLANTFVRTGPGENYPAYGIANTGVTGGVLGKSEDGLWWVVRINPEVVGVGNGWVAAAYTQASNVENVPVVAAPPLTAAPQPPPPASGAPYGVTTAAVNVRSGPSTAYPVYGVAPAGTTGEIIGKSADGGWWQFKADPAKIPAGNAWVSASYVMAYNTANVPVTTAPAPPPTVPVTPPPTTTEAYGVATEAVNVRSGPSTSYPSYGVVPAGASAPIIGKSADGGWWQFSVDPAKVSAGNVWVSASYVTAYNVGSVPVVEAPPMEEAVQLPAEPPSTSGPYLVTTEPLNVRSGPGNSYPSYGVVPAGTTLTAIGISQDGTWFVVAIPTSIAANGQGWVSGAYVTAYNTAGLPVIPNP
jgi:uncharacterized protein YraI